MSGWGSRSQHGEVGRSGPLAPGHIVFGLQPLRTDAHNGRVALPGFRLAAIVVYVALIKIRYPGHITAAAAQTTPWLPEAVV